MRALHSATCSRRAVFANAHASAQRGAAAAMVLACCALASVPTGHNAAAQHLRDTHVLHCTRDTCPSRLHTSSGTAQPLCGLSGPPPAYPVASVRTP
jgi:hypothetical protein